MAGAGDGGRRRTSRRRGRVRRPHRPAALRLADVASADYPRRRLICPRVLSALRAADSTVIGGAQHLSARFRSGRRVCWESSPIPMTRPSAPAARSPSTRAPAPRSGWSRSPRAEPARSGTPSVGDPGDPGRSSGEGTRRGRQGARAHRDEMSRLSGRRARRNRRSDPGQAGVGAAQRDRSRRGDHVRAGRVLRTSRPRRRRSSGHRGLLRDAIRHIDPALPLPPAAKQDAAARPPGRVGRRADDPLQGHEGLRPRAVGLLARDDSARICRRLRQGRMVSVRLVPHRTG